MRTPLTICPLIVLLCALALAPGQLPPSRAVAGTGGPRSVVAGSVVAGGRDGGRPSSVATQPATAPASQPQIAATRPAGQPGLVRIHVFVSGHVQNVGFRAFTTNAAYDLKVTGWVANLDDGRVEIVAESTPEAIRKFLKAVRKGPDAAQVDKVEVKDEPATGKFTRFGGK